MYEYADGDQRVSPFPLEKLAELARKGLVSAHMPVAPEGSEDWQPAPELFENNPKAWATLGLRPASSPSLDTLYNLTPNHIINTLRLSLSSAHFA